MFYKTLEKMHIETKRNGITDFGWYAAGVLDMEDKGKKAYCATSCPCFSEDRKHLCTGHCNKFDTFVRFLEE